jgi:hypothetical protein
MHRRAGAMKRSIIILALLAINLAATTAAQGALVKYSWSGTITPQRDSTDPFGLGGTKSFDVEAILDADALSTACRPINVARPTP